MTLYDTAGVERHTQTMLPTYFRRAKAIILVYSIDSTESFEDVGANWLDNSLNSESTARLFLVGNKLDLARGDGGGRSKRRVKPERAVQYALNNDIDRSMVFEVSAKTGENLEEMFTAVADAIAPAIPPPQTTREEPKPKPNCC